MINNKIDSEFDISSSKKHFVSIENLHILLVEDNIINQEIVKGLLDKSGDKQ